MHPDDNKIEKYLLHQLSEQEKRQFELQLMVCHQFREKVEAYKLVFQTIKASNVKSKSEKKD
jgi:hypothetical protein